jgi:short-subunit dehydrogenase
MKPPATGPQAPAALVTGASSGLGEALARALAAGGYRLILVSENAPELERVRRGIAADAAVEPRALVEDLALPGAGGRLHERCRQLGWPVEVLVNCAGIFLNLQKELAEPSSAERMLALHVQTPTQLCLRFGSEMIERRRGFILNVASISALFPDPSSLTYGASKRYLLALSAGLRLSWRECGVRVCCLVPGGTRTAFFVHNDIYLPGMVAARLYPPEKCARRALAALFRGRGRITPGLSAHLNVLLFRLLLTPPLYGFSKRLYFRLRSAGGQQSSCRTDGHTGVDGSEKGGIF